MRTGPDHTLNPDRARELRAILDGKAPAVNRERYAWFCRQGYLKPTDRHENPAARWVVGSALAYSALGMAPSEDKRVVFMQHGGYRMSR